VIGFQKFKMLWGGVGIGCPTGGKKGEGAKKSLKKKCIKKTKGTQNRLRATETKLKEKGPGKTKKKKRGPGKWPRVGGDGNVGTIKHQQRLGKAETPGGNTQATFKRGPCSG